MAWYAARAASAPSAIQLPSMPPISDGHSESRPNSVRNHGTPAATNGGASACGIASACRSCRPRSNGRARTGSALGIGLLAAWALGRRILNAADEMAEQAPSLVHGQTTEYRRSGLRQIDSAVSLHVGSRR